MNDVCRYSRLFTALASHSPTSLPGMHIEPFEPLLGEDYSRATALKSCKSICGPVRNGPQSPKVHYPKPFPFDEIGQKRHLPTARDVTLTEALAGRASNKLSALWTPHGNQQSTAELCRHPVETGETSRANRASRGNKALNTSTTRCKSRGESTLQMARFLRRLPSHL